MNCKKVPATTNPNSVDGVYSYVKRRKNNIFCPLCLSNREPLANNKSLIDHIEKFHDIIIETEDLYFITKDDFESWRKLDKRSLHYVIRRTNGIGTQTGTIRTIYDCNLSNSRGYQCIYTGESLKKRCSLKINGVCPSRITATVYAEGDVRVQYIKTHVGHKTENNLENDKLTPEEEEEIIKKLKAGVPCRILIKESRDRLKKGTNSTQKHVLNVNDIKYLRSKFRKRRKLDVNMTSVAAKVAKWNSNGNNSAFLFKNIGESHPKLKKEDFALGYMNSTMQTIFKHFSRIICIDGTRATSSRRYEMTVIMVIDNKNEGFPIAFFFSNRQDQIIQEVYLEAFKNHVKHTIEPEYIITDDNLRFYKAWTKVMNHSPKRLIHTWHVINCWNCKGKVLIQNRGMKSEMKYKLKKIMTACNQEDFITLKNAYFERLEEQNQTAFLKYLQTEYFYDEDQIKLWAYYHRMHAGINKIMALERCLGMYKKSLIRNARRTSAEALLESWETYDKMCSLTEPEEMKVLPNIYLYDVTFKSEGDQEVLVKNDKLVETKKEIEHNADLCHVTIKSEPVIENKSIEKKITEEPSTNEKEMDKKTQDFIEFSSMVGETEFFLQNEFLELDDADRKVVLRSFAFFLDENVKCNSAKRKIDNEVLSQSTKKSKSVLQDK